MTKSRLIKVKVDHKDGYNYEDDLNWRDDGDALTDPSANDYMLGYKLDPYAQRQWAGVRSRLRKKQAVHEVVQVGYTPTSLAEYMLSIWDRVDGTLQDLFEGFTVRYNNELKTAIASELKQRGYEVFPQLTDDRAFYASRFEAAFTRLVTANVRDKIHLCRIVLNKSEPLRLCVGELDDIHELGNEVTADDASDVLNYYKQIFPDDFAIGLCTDYVNGKDKVDITNDHFQDFSLSDDSLRSVEKMMSGNQDPWYKGMSGGGEFGWDYVSDMRGFDGVRPEQYEVTSRRVTADVVGDIPLSIIEPVIDKGCENIHNVLEFGFAAPPRHVRTIRKQLNRAEGFVDFDPAIDVPDLVTVYEVWEVSALADNGVDVEYWFIVISAKCKLAGMTQPDWSNVEYRGFYSTVDEAENNISGHMV